MNPNEPDPLDRLVAEWREPAPPAPDLRRRVWARIVAAEASAPTRRFSAWLDELRALWGQRTTLAFVVFCVVLGVLSAELRATRTPMQDVGRMATTYLQAINPLLRSGSGGPP